MFAKIIEQISKYVMLPLLKELGAYIYEKYVEYKKQKELEKKLKQSTDRAINEQDQREIEEEISDQSGEPSGRGRIVDSIPLSRVHNKKRNKPKNLVE